MCPDVIALTESSIACLERCRTRMVVSINLMERSGRDTSSAERLLTMIERNLVGLHVRLRALVQVRSA
ncbi:hypothetical protein [Methylobacterium nodulans]|uniref:Uncharacterized protein n=1 Tax=Methylobacterium nodulans (strain LMG 21967 / CNCM I-2342 / ORS 2060) TaxID=460265 RepID=B8IGG4_METNO|nr:hypothetical protein [Methylobacterium nodulans]ACL55864.1 hypothetical protein Mnod_0836 [Methylobacterium nodulans ORS 2060]